MGAAGACLRRRERAALLKAGGLNRAFAKEGEMAV